MKIRVLAVAGVCLVWLAGCAKAPAPSAQRATVTLRDGRTIPGLVQSSSASQIRILGDDGVTQTIPMDQVRNIDYGAAAPAAGGAPADGQAAGATGGPGSAPGGDPDADHDHHYHADQAQVTTKTFVVPAGTQVTVRTEETIDSARAVEGQTYAAEVAKDVRDAAGDCVVPRGANAQLMIRSVSKGGHFRGASDLVMDLASVSVGGQSYRVQTTDVAEKGHAGIGANKRTAEFAGGGGAFGAIVGAIAGGGKGAAIGAGAGAGGGALAEILTKGRIKVPAESVLTFRLEAPLGVVAAQ
jgi:hypothetical protein